MAPDSRTSHARVSCTVSALKARLRSSGAYSATIQVINCDVAPLRYQAKGATSKPEWTDADGVQNLEVFPGMHTLKIELHQKSRFGASTLIGSASIPLFSLLPGATVEATVIDEHSEAPARVVGTVSICLSRVSALQRANLESGEATLGKYQASRSLYGVYKALCRLQDHAPTATTTCTTAAVVYLHAVLKYLLGHPECIATEPRFEDQNVAKDLIFQLDRQATYYCDQYMPKVRAAGTRIPSLAEEMLTTVTKAIILIFGFINHYQACGYRVLQSVSRVCYDSFCDLQLRLLVLRARMDDIYGKEYPLNTSLSAFIRFIADKSSIRFIGSGSLSGRYRDLFSCIRSENMVRALMDAYKTVVDESAIEERNKGISGAEYRSSARRLMTTLARDTDVLPSGLIIPDSYLHVESQPVSRGIPKAEDGERGGYAVVRWGKKFDKSLQRDVAVAIKTIASHTTRDIKKTYIEVMVGWTLAHPRLLSTEGINRSVGGLGQISIVSQRMSGNLSARLHEPGFVSRSSQEKLRQLNTWLLQIAEGLAYMHEEGVIHGDLHGRNIFIDNRSGLSEDIVIGDFGVSVFADAHSKAFDSTRSGKWNYLAPELIPLDNAPRERRLPPQALLSPSIAKSLAPPMHAIRGHPASTSTRVGLPPAAINYLVGIPEEHISPSRRPTKQSDLFSFAMLFIELYTGKEPFSGYDVVTIRSKILGGERPEMPALVRDIPRLQRRISTCWQQQPAQREDAQRLLQDLRQLNQP